MKPAWSRPKTRIATIASLSTTLLVSTSARAADLSFQCVNSASGASWTLMVDDQKRTVDGTPADMSAARISWRDAASGGIYDLDLKSGALTFTNSSSTGGYMLFHRCQMK